MSKDKLTRNDVFKLQFAVRKIQQDKINNLIREVNLEEKENYTKLSKILRDINTNKLPSNITKNNNLIKQLFDIANKGKKYVLSKDDIKNLASLCKNIDLSEQNQQQNKKISNKNKITPLFIYNVKHNDKDRKMLSYKENGIIKYEFENGYILPNSLGNLYAKKFNDQKISFEDLKKQTSQPQTVEYEPLTFDDAMNDNIVKDNELADKETAVSENDSIADMSDFDHLNFESKEILVVDKYNKKQKDLTTSKIEENLVLANANNTSVNNVAI